jgi:hypothetical protein
MMAPKRMMVLVNTMMERMKMKEIILQISTQARMNGGLKFSSVMKENQLQ